MKHISLTLKLPLLLAGIVAMSMGIAVAVTLSESGQAAPEWVRTRMLPAGGIAILLAAACGLLIGARMRRSLKDVTMLLDRVGTREAVRPLPGRGDEIGQLRRVGTALADLLSRESEERTITEVKSAAADATSAALMITDPDFRILHLNRAILDMFHHRAPDLRATLGEFDPDALVGCNMDVFHKRPEHIRALVSNPERLPFYADIPVGEVRLQVGVNPIRSESGAITGMVVEWTDVTDERRKEALIAAIETGQVLAEFAPDGTLRSANARFRDCCPTVAEGSGVDDLLRREEVAEDTDVHAELAAGRSVPGPFELIDPAGTVTALVDGGLYPIRASNGASMGFALIGNDVTEARRDLARAEAARRAFADEQSDVVEKLRLGLHKLSGGNLSQRLDQAFGDEYEQLRSDFNEAMSTLDATLSEFARETAGMQLETKEISDAAGDMATRTEQLAVTLQENAARLDELTGTVASTADGAVRASEAASEARQRAEKSGTVVDEAESAMAEISRSSSEVGKVISVIDDIAFQTNLLALNAGVEAARAGEAGRGFAVVATEVRALAQRCSDAAAEISTLITASDKHVTRGVSLVGQAGEALKSIVQSITEISDHVADIARAGKDQSDGLAQVNAATTQIDQATQSNAAMFEQTNAASQALARRATAMYRTISRFSLSDAEAPADRKAVVTPLPVSRKPRAKPDVETVPAELRPTRTQRTSGNAALKAEPGHMDEWEEF